MTQVYSPTQRKKAKLLNILRDDSLIVERLINDNSLSNEEFSFLISIAWRLMCKTCKFKSKQKISLYFKKQTKRTNNHSYYCYSIYYLNYFLHRWHLQLHKANVTPVSLLHSEIARLVPRTGSQFTVLYWEQGMWHSYDLDEASVSYFARELAY